MREEFNARRNVEGKASMQVNSADASGKIVMDLENITHTFGERSVIRNFSTRVMRGDKF